MIARALLLGALLFPLYWMLVASLTPAVSSQRIILALPSAASTWCAASRLRW